MTGRTRLDNAGHVRWDDWMDNTPLKGVSVQCLSVSVRLDRRSLPFVRRSRRCFPNWEYPGPIHSLRSHARKPWRNQETSMSFRATNRRNEIEA